MRRAPKVGNGQQRDVGAPYPLMPVSVTPWMKSRWVKKTKSTTGTTAIVAAAASVPRTGKMWRHQVCSRILPREVTSGGKSSRIVCHTIGMLTPEYS